MMGFLFLRQAGSLDCRNGSMIVIKDRNKLIQVREVIIVMSQTLLFLQMSGVLSPLYGM